MLSHTFRQPKSWVLAHGDYEPLPSEIQTIDVITSKLLRGVPLPYILERWEFHGRNFSVTPDVLIPRPETELLVERAISIAKLIEQPHIVDVGTGSGVIAISLAAELPQAILIASDLSWQALRVAQGNADRLGQAHIQFLQANLLQPLVGPFDLVCANLPYIPSHRLAALEVSKHEPRLALDGGESGLDLLRNLLAEAETRLAPTGTLLLEIESSLGSEALTLTQHFFPTAQVILHQDLAGHNRLIEIQSKEAL